MTTLGPRFDDALVYTMRVTGEQMRKGSDVPYISHPLGVCSLVIEDGGDEDEAIAALLHDLVEDHGGSERAEDIRTRFGDRVADIVIECSDSTDGPRDESDWQERKQAYIEALGKHSPGAIRVSLADKLHNARAISRDVRAAGDAPDEFWKRFHAGREAQLWYYGSLVAKFRDISQSPMVEELAAAVESMG